MSFSLVGSQIIARHYHCTALLIVMHTQKLLLTTLQSQLKEALKSETAHEKYLGLYNLQP